ncbi:MAG: hypothetical protein CR971_01525 [candidate division SR1 bacterium]|nr:MAG: hypothetical protein CR971_01525 [candidate division SR1 bacterium]
MTVYFEKYLMSKKDKIREQLLQNPTNLSLSKILSFLESEGYRVEQPTSGSHHKIRHLASDRYETIAIHHNDCKPIYKILLKKLYLKNI